MVVIGAIRLNVSVVLIQPQAWSKILISILKH